jgi:hypothetical protein
VTRVNDPGLVRDEYASERRLTHADAAASVEATRGLWPSAPDEVDVDVPFRVRTRPVVLVAQNA